MSNYQAQQYANAIYISGMLLWLIQTIFNCGLSMLLIEYLPKPYGLLVIIICIKLLTSSIFDLDHYPTSKHHGLWDMFRGYWWFQLVFPFVFMIQSPESI